jgi:putative ABC transport system permease protein
VIAAFIVDLRAAWRGLMRSRMLLVTASVVLGLGLAATVFMLTVMNTLYVRPPPYRDANRLYRVFGQHEQTREIQDELQYSDYLELREAQEVEDAAAVTWTEAVITGGGVAQRFDAAEVSTNFFDFVGAAPMLGRTFTDRDGLPGSESVAVLSSETWSGQYASDESIVGKRIDINGEPRTVIGVLRPGFGLIGGEAIWLPIVRNPDALSRESDSAQYGWLIAKARLGVSQARLADGLKAVMDRLQREQPKTNEALSSTVLPLGAGIIGHANVSSLRRQLAGAYVTLLIACLTVAGLLFVRATYRQYETAMRSALGARRWRLIQLTLCEALIISAFALFVAYFASVLALQYYDHLIDAIGTYGGVPPWWEFEIDWKVVGVSVVAALLSALLAGLFPAIEASRTDVARLLRDRAHVTGSPRLTRFMSVMVVIELAAAAALLCGAMLLARGAYTAVGKGFGVDPDAVMTGSISLPEGRYASEEYAQFIDNVLGRMRAHSGVQGAAMTTSLPGLGASRVSVAIGGEDIRPVAELPMADDVSVSSGFFGSIGGRVLGGREFDSRDTRSSPPVAIVNSEFAALHFGGASPVGQKIAFPTEDGAPIEWITVVGVVGNMLHSATWGVNGSWRPTVYTPLTQYELPYMSVAVRGGGAPADQMRLIREVIAEVDTDLPVYLLRPLKRAQSERRAGYQLASVSMLGFSFIAVILAIVGMYVVLSFTVEQRTKEIAIRRALGASDRQVVSTVVRGTAWQVAVGLMVSAALTPIAVNLVSALMEGLQTREWWIYATAYCLVVLAVVVASGAPARRALRVEPAILLRVE